MNYRDEFAHNIYNILCIDESDKFIKLKSNILRKHTENLHINGDYSIGLEKNIWKREISSDEIEQLVQSTKELQMPIHKYTIHKNRVIIHLERIIIMKNVLKTIEVNPENYGKYNNEKLPVINVTIDYATANFDTVTDCRLDLIKATLENLLSYSTSTDLTKTTIDIKITTKPYLKNNNTLICGIVFDPSDQTDSKKMSKMSTSDYVKKRSIDMQLLAQHKYGLRVQNEKVFIDLIENLGKAAVIVDLMEVKFTAPVGLATVPGLSSSKGAPFILYNSARLETLFRTFNERVEGGVYQSLPLIDEIDLSLLKEEVSQVLMIRSRIIINFFF